MNDYRTATPDELAEETARFKRAARREQTMVAPDRPVAQLSENELDIVMEALAYRYCSIRVSQPHAALACHDVYMELMNRTEQKLEGGLWRRLLSSTSRVPA